MESEQVKTAVRERYGEVARGEATCGSLCGCTENAEGLAITFGYSADELATLPEGANLGLSCGNPQAVAALQPGEVCSTWAAGPESTVSLPPGRSGRPGGWSASI